MRQIHKKHMHLLGYAADHADRFAEIHPRVAWRMRQGDECHPGPRLRMPDIILHDRIAAAEPVLGFKALENTLARVPLLRRRHHIPRQDCVDHWDKRSKLRLPWRLCPHITRRRREPAHFGNRVPA
jgi:hypothetical protein